MNFQNTEPPKRNTWYKTNAPDSPRPPFEEYVFVWTLEGLGFLAFRKSNKFFCATPTPQGVMSVELEEWQIDQWMMPSFPSDADKEQKPSIELVNETHPTATSN